MTIWGLGGGVGVIGGGAIGQWLHNRRRAYMPLFVGACVAAAAFPIWFLINADVGRLPLPISFIAGFLGGALASPPGPNARFGISDFPLATYGNSLGRASGVAFL